MGLHRDEAKWREFRLRYKAELLGRSDLLAALKKKAENGAVTLLYAAKDEKHNHAVVLLEQLEKL